MWPFPYPWKSDVQYGKALDALIKQSKQITGKVEGQEEVEVQREGHIREAQLILLTHMGSHASATSVFSFNTTHVIHAGSPAQTEVIMEHFGKRDVNDSNISIPLLCNIHGHVHPAQGLDSTLPNHIRQINPGPLYQGYYYEINPGPLYQGYYYDVLLVPVAVPTITILY